MSQKILSEEEILSQIKMSESIRQAAQERTEYAQKKFAVDKKRTDSLFEEIKEKEEQQKALEGIELVERDDSYYERLGMENDEYFELARTAPVFLHKGFKGKVPFFAKQLILVGAKSGQGKSTLTANLAFHTARQGGQILILTNEEKDNDVFNRVTCLTQGWRYTNHEDFTEEQRRVFKENYKKLGKHITIINDDYTGKGGTTTTREGIRAILEKVLNSKKKFEAIVIDYFQNIKSSTEHPFLDEWKLLDKVVDDLEYYRLKLNCPIILLSQLKATDEEFKFRIERCKSVYNRATCAMEIISHYDEGLSEFKIHKSRFSDAIGKSIWALFDRGLYAYYDPAEADSKKHADFMDKVKK